LSQFAISIYYASSFNSLELITLKLAPANSSSSAFDSSSPAYFTYGFSKPVSEPLYLPGDVSAISVMLPLCAVRLPSGGKAIWFSILSI